MVNSQRSMAAVNSRSPGQDILAAILPMTDDQWLLTIVRSLRGSDAAYITVYESDKRQQFLLKRVNVILGEVLKVVTCNQVVDEFVRRSSGDTTELNVFFEMESAVSFSHVCGE
jgi:hypothetical protein